MTSTATNCFNGTDGTATVNVVGGTTPYSYNWSTGGVNATVTGLSLEHIQ